MAKEGVEGEKVKPAAQGEELTVRAWAAEADTGPARPGEEGVGGHRRTGGGGNRRQGTARGRAGEAGGQAAR